MRRWRYMHTIWNMVLVFYNIIIMSMAHLLLARLRSYAEAMFVVNANAAILGDVCRQTTTDRLPSAERFQRNASAAFSDRQFHDEVPRKIGHHDEIVMPNAAGRIEGDDDITLNATLCNVRAPMTNK